MDTTIIDGISLEVVEHDGKRYVKKPAGGQGGGGTGFVLELLGDALVAVVAAEPPAAPAAERVMIPAADAEAIKEAVEKAEADIAHNQS